MAEKNKYQVQEIIDTDSNGTPDAAVVKKSTAKGGKIPETIDESESLKKAGPYSKYLKHGNRGRYTMELDANPDWWDEEPDEADNWWKETLKDADTVDVINEGPAAGNPMFTLTANDRNALVNAYRRYNDGEEPEEDDLNWMIRLTSASRPSYWKQFGYKLDEDDSSDEYAPDEEDVALDKDMSPDDVRKYFEDFNLNHYLTNSDEPSEDGKVHWTARGLKKDVNRLRKHRSDEIDSTGTVSESDDNINDSDGNDESMQNIIAALKDKRF